jgi:hypothetical protein
VVLLRSERIRPVVGRDAIPVGDGLRGDFFAIIFALKQFAGFGEGKEGSVD